MKLNISSRKKKRVRSAMNPIRINKHSPRKTEYYLSTVETPGRTSYRISNRLTSARRPLSSQRYTAKYHSSSKIQYDSEIMFPSTSKNHNRVFFKKNSQRPSSSYFQDLPSNLKKIQKKYDKFSIMETLEDGGPVKFNGEMMRFISNMKRIKNKPKMLKCTDKATVNVMLKRNEIIKGRFYIIDGRFPGRVHLDFNSKKFNFEVYWNLENLSKNKADRTWVVDKFVIKSRKIISEFYFILRAQAKVKGVMDINFLPIPPTPPPKDPFELFEESEKYEIAAKSLMIKKLQENTFLKKNKIMRPFTKEERRNRIKKMAEDKDRQIKLNRERRNNMKSQRKFRKVVLANRTQIRNQIVRKNFFIFF